MEHARRAMESVKLGSSGGVIRPGFLWRRGIPSVARLVGNARARMSAAGAGAVNGATRTLHWVWHRIGYGAFRMLSTLNLIFAVVVGVASQVLAYYYRGALNVDPAICALFYTPALAGMAVMREALQENGSSDSGIAPSRSRAVLFAYAAMLISAGLAIGQPIAVRWANGISGTSMWISILGTVAFFYALLISEVLFAAAVNIKRSRYGGTDDEEGELAGDVQDYGAI